MGTKVKLSNVRLFFPDLWKAVQFDGKGEFRYGATLGIKKDDTKQIALIEDAIKQQAAEVFKDKAAARIKEYRGNSNKCFFQDGDNKGYDGVEGLMLVSARRREKDGRPLVMDRNKSPVEEKDGVIYSGCYVNASIEVWAQSGEYAGLRCTLLGVQKFADGDAFSGASKPDSDDFEQLEEGASAEDMV